MATFTTWLKQYEHEDEDSETPLGDLARDVAEDSFWPDDGDDYRTFYNHIYGRGACDAALETLKAAWTKYDHERKKGYLK